VGTEPEVRRKLSEAGRALGRQHQENVPAMVEHYAEVARLIPALGSGRGRDLSLNRVKESSAMTDADVQCSPARDRDADLPDYGRAAAI
jgi:hypothetical protein